MYLLRRGQTYHFSRKLPEQWKSCEIALASGPKKVGGNGYLRFSLATGNKREAERLARKYAVEVDEALQAQPSLNPASQRQVIPQTEPQGVVLQEWLDQLPAPLRAHFESIAKPLARPIFTPEEIQHAAAMMHAALLQEDETLYRQAMAACFSRDGAENSLEESVLPLRDDHEFLEDLPATGAAGDVALLRIIQPYIARYLQAATGKSTTFWRLSEAYGQFATAFRNVVQDLRRRQAGEAAVPTPSPLEPLSAPESQLGPDWEDLLDCYCQQHPGAAEATVRTYSLAIRELAAHAQCRPAKLSKKQAIAWRDHLVGKLAPKTASTRLTAAGTVYRYALRYEKLGERGNPFEGIVVAGAKSARGSRRGYVPEELRRLFEPLPKLDEIAHAAGKHAGLWVPLLALYTGARRRELTGLLVEDVADYDGIVYLRLWYNGIRNLKNSHNERKIPLHRQLIELGFPAYVAAVREAGETRLFPGIVSPDGLSEWWSDYVATRVPKPAGVKLDLHSFRHLFKTAARDAGIGMEIHDMLTGHTTPGVGSSYGQQAGICRLKSEVDKIQYPGLQIAAPPVPIPDEIRTVAARAERRRRTGQLRRQP